MVPNRQREKLPEMSWRIPQRLVNIFALAQK